jgi:hypothetical protein
MAYAFWISVIVLEVLLVLGLLWLVKRLGGLQEQLSTGRDPGLAAIRQWHDQVKQIGLQTEYWEFRLNNFKANRGWKWGFAMGMLKKLGSIDFERNGHNHNEFQSKGHIVRSN